MKTIYGKYHLCRYNKDKVIRRSQDLRITEHSRGGHSLLVTLMLLAEVVDSVTTFCGNS